MADRGKTHSETSPWNADQHAERIAGLAFAREWRARTREEFDALFGPEQRCSKCGHFIGDDAETAP